jgi:benzoate membrane transport protein
LKVRVVQPIGAGIVGAIAGFATSFALVIAALQAMGATAAQASSGLLALCLVVGILSIAFTLWLRIPVSFAWSTPGAALLIAAGNNNASFAAAIGAFIVCALLIVLCGVWPALGALITRIPRSIANAMLAGILLPICLAPVQAAVEVPLLALPVILTWLVLARLAPRWAVPTAMVVTIIVIVLSVNATEGSSWLTGVTLVPQLAFVAPIFDPLVILSVGLPLFIVTMAGQNVPGFAVMNTFGYTVPHRAAFVGTGVASASAALFGGHVINLAAITAAIMASPEAGDDKNQRWIAPFTAGIGYLVLGLGAGVATALVSASPPILIVAVAGLAVLGALVSSITAALEQPEHRTAAAATFLVVASGAVILTIGSALWGLLVGGAIMAWLRPRRGAPGE